MQQPVKIILGIDPGTIVMGYGLIKIHGNQVSLLEMNALKLSGKKDIYDRLLLIHQHVSGLIEKFRPDSFAIEAPFFGKNVQSMLKLGRAQGVAIAAAMQGNIPVTEYSPKKVKQSITGNGNASKEQVWHLLKQTLFLQEAPTSFDATDALAVALCHHYQCSSPLAAISGQKKNGWEDFILKNPGRVV